MTHSASIETAETETALMLTLAQVVEGDVTCSYCDDPALFTVATGADPDPEPVCPIHALPFIKVAEDFTARFNKPA